MPQGETTPQLFKIETIRTKAWPPSLVFQQLCVCKAWL